MSKKNKRGGKFNKDFVLSKNKFDVSDLSKDKTAKQRILSPTMPKVLTFGFALLIFLGALILSLKCCQTEPVSFIDALFISTSATTVTGLSTVWVGEKFSTLGIFVILVLMQIGAIGIMTFVCLAFMFVNKKLNIKNRTLLEEEFDFEGDKISTVLIRIVIFVFWTEIIGAILLAIRFIPMYGLKLGIFNSIFMSVAAFCNSGFSLIGADSLVLFQDDVLINVTIMLLIFLGSLGYIVVLDVINKVAYAKKNKRSLKSAIKRFSLNTKIILMTTLILVLFGALEFFFVEIFNPNTLGSSDIGWGTKILASFFHSISSRSGGFQTLDLAKCNMATILTLIVLMFIGGSPSSTGGGIKTIVIATLFMTILANLKNDDETVVFNRKISEVYVRRALVCFSLGVFIVLTGIFTMTLFEPNMQLHEIIFEVVSGFSTTGMSLNVTPFLSVASKILLIILMYIGRLGIPCLIMFLSKNSTTNLLIEYPEEKIIMG